MNTVINEIVDMHEYVEGFLSRRREETDEGNSVDILRLIALELLEKYKSSAEWVLDYHAINNEEREDLQKECRDWRELIDYCYGTSKREES